MTMFNRAKQAVSRTFDRLTGRKDKTQREQARAAAVMMKEIDKDRKRAQRMPKKRRGVFGQRFAMIWEIRRLTGATMCRASRQVTRRRMRGISLG